MHRVSKTVVKVTTSYCMLYLADINTVKALLLWGRFVTPFVSYCEVIVYAC